MHKLAIASAALLGIAGCSANSHLAAAEREVERFHDLAAEQQVERLYDQSTDEFKRAATPEQFRSLMQVIDERLGNVRRANRQGWHVNYTTAGTVVTLTYDTQFERGRGTERFAYRIDAESPRLLGFHVNSDALVARPSSGAEEGDEGADGDREVTITAPSRR
jgi:hypothetical protein